MFDLGSVLTLTHTFVDSNGDNVDPASITVTIQLPDLSTTTVTATKVSVGNYTATYTPAVAGRYAVTWVPTGGSQAFTDVFNVGQQFSAAIVSLADMRAKLNKHSTSDDALLSSIIRAATAVVESFCGPCASRTVVETVSTSSGGQASVIVSQCPVLTVTSIVPQYPYGVTPDPSTFVLDTVNGVVTLNTGLFFVGRYTVTYTAGRQVIPSSLQEACLLIGRNIYELQRGGSIAVTNMGSDEITVDPALLTSVTPRARELLGPHLIAPGV